MKHGVSQGSILGPPLFIVFINDLPLHVSSSNIDLYADDTTISSSADSKNIATLQDSLNRSVLEVVDWANKNKLPLNQKKTKVLLVKGKRLSSKTDNVPVISCNGSPLPSVTSPKLLGLDIDEGTIFLRKYLNELEC